MEAPINGTFYNGMLIFNVIQFFSIFISPSIRFQKLNIFLLKKSKNQLEKLIFWFWGFFTFSILKFRYSWKNNPLTEKFPYEPRKSVYWNTAWIMLKLWPSVDCTLCSQRLTPIIKIHWNLKITKNLLPLRLCIQKA